MKKFYFLLVTLLITTTTFGQAILLIENFSGTPLYTLDPDMPEQIVSTTAYFTRTDGSNIAAVITNSDGESYFAVQDINTAPMASPATMLFDNIDIATYTNLTFGVVLAEDDASDGGEDWDSSDFVHFQYRIDNTGSWKNLVWVENEGTTNSRPQIDTDFDGVGDGVILTDEFGDDINFSIPETGSLIDIRVTFGGLTSKDEDIAIEFIYLVDSFNLFPSVTITSPTDFQVFPSGTPNVDVGYTIANTPERVDIEVNGVLTSNIGNVGPFNVTTTDGGTYTAAIYVYAFGGVLISDETIDFSVNSSLGIDTNETESFSLYPNPTSLGYINIISRTNNAIQVSVFDILGKQIINSTVVNNKLDVSNLNSGVYIMRLTQNNTIVTKKLVIN